MHMIILLKRELEGKISEILDTIDFNHENSISEGMFIH